MAQSLTKIKRFHAKLCGQSNKPRVQNVSRSVGISHIVRQDDGTSIGIWGAYQLRTAFQPIFTFTGGKLSLSACEGLARPFRDDKPMPPGEFFANVPPADRFHVETLTRMLHLLNAGACLDRSMTVFVNFDPSLFSDTEIIDKALRDMRLVLHEADLDPHRIVCEVTEQRSHTNAALHGFVRALRAHGFRIAVDDYGSEDSDIGRINELKPDIVKFDARWITRLMESGPGFALLAAMVSEFAGRGIRTVFEGIEESWQLELAERSGAHMVQGFVLARPELAPTSFSVFKAPGRAQAEAGGSEWRAGASSAGAFTTGQSRTVAFGRRTTAR